MMGRKTLTNIVLGTLFTFGSVGCDSKLDEEYTFSGRIGKDCVSFYELGFLAYDNILSVKKEDGSFVKYRDKNSDFILEEVVTKVKGNETSFYLDSSNPAEVEVVKKAQVEFDKYLKAIIEIQTAPIKKD